MIHQFDVILWHLTHNSMRTQSQDTFAEKKNTPFCETSANYNNNNNKENKTQQTTKMILLFSHEEEKKTDLIISL